MNDRSNRNAASRCLPVRRMVPALAVAIGAACGAAASSSATQAQEYIVSQQVVSDVKVEGGFANSQYSGDSYSGDAGGACASGNCGAGGVGGTNGSYVGDMGIGVVNRAYGQPDLFYNYFTQGNANSANAQMYVSPLPVPPNVGHTYLTYQPFYPEEMLYWHKNKFHNYYDNGRGMNRTRATYFSPPVRQTASNIYWNFLRIPR